MASPLRTALASASLPSTPHGALPTSHTSTPINAATALVQRTHSPSSRRRRGTRASPYTKAAGGAEHSSPSRQLIDEYARWQAESDRQFRAKLDAHERELKRLHDAELAASAERSREVLRGVERERELLAMRIENEVRRRRLEEEEQQERVRRERIRIEREEEQQKIEKLQRAEREATEAREQIRKMAEGERTEKETRERLANEERERQEAADRQQRDEEERQRQAAQQAVSQTNGVNGTNGTTAQASRPAQTPAVNTQPVVGNAQGTNSSLEEEHAAYLALHKKLKDMRKYVLGEFKKAKQNPQKSMTKEIGNMRRELQKLLGQTTSDLKKNREVVGTLSQEIWSNTNTTQRDKVITMFKSAWNNTEIAVDAKELIIRPTQPFPAGDNTQVSGIFTYLLNVLIKACIHQWESAAHQTAYNASDYYGVIVSFILSEPAFVSSQNSFADIVLAKYHHAAPPLFGITAPDSTAPGRARLGWSRDADGAFVDRQTHNDRTNALAIGFGALTLRDYSRVTTRTNALPAWHYWRALAGIANAPAPHLTQTLAITLKGLVDQYAHLFVRFYGAAAVLALRRVIVELPGLAPGGSGWESVAVVRDNLRNSYGLAL